MMSKLSNWQTSSNQNNKQGELQMEYNTLLQAVLNATHGTELPWEKPERTFGEMGGVFYSGGTVSLVRLVLESQKPPEPWDNAIPLPLQSVVDYWKNKTGVFAGRVRNALSSLPQVPEEAFGMLAYAVYAAYRGAVERAERDAAFSVFPFKSGDTIERAGVAAFQGVEGRYSKHGKPYGVEVWEIEGDDGNTYKVDVFRKHFPVEDGERVSFSAKVVKIEHAADGNPIVRISFADLKAE
jgi:hypothetical protein